MESGRTWVVKVRMSQPRQITEDTGEKAFTEEVFTKDDLDELRSRLRDNARLRDASLEDDGAIVVWFETSEWSLDEKDCPELDLAKKSLPPGRQPLKGDCKHFPEGPTTISRPG